MGHQQTLAQILHSFLSTKLRLRRSALPWLFLLVLLYLVLLWRGRSSGDTNLK